MREPCYVFDIDGTLADCSHRLHFIVRKPGDERPKDWRSFFAACADDVPIDHICNIARAIQMAGGKVVFVTGRSDECHAATRRWLRPIAYGASMAALYMRRAGDHRDDCVVKLELLAQLRADGFEPIMVFEDRKRVVDMWRAAGIPCAQVAEGDF